MRIAVCVWARAGASHAQARSSYACVWARRGHHRVRDWTQRYRESWVVGQVAVCDSAAEDDAIEVSKMEIGGQRSIEFSEQRGTLRGKGAFYMATISIMDRIWWRGTGSSHV